MTQVVEADSIAAELAAIWQRARPTVLARLEAIEKAAAVLSSGSLGAEERTSAEHESHKLAGIAGTLGFPNVTVYAREAEALLGGTAALDAAQVARLNELVLLSRAEFDGAHPVSSVLAVDPGPANPRVALYAFEPELGMSFHAIAARYQLDVVFRSDEPTPEAIESGAGACDVCVARVGFAQGDVDRIRRARDQYPEVPVLAWTDDESFAHRVECVRAGANRIVSGAAASAALLHAIHATLPKLGSHRGVVLAAGIPPVLFGDLVAPVRASNGLIIEIEPSAILSALKALPTSVVLIGEGDGATNALDVCRVIRADAGGVAIPIMVLEDSEARAVKELQDTGAIEVKPIALDVVERLRPFLAPVNAHTGSAGGHEEGKKKADGVGASTREHVDVALVDDDELVTMLVEDALNAAGYSYRVIHDGVTASAALAGRVAPLTATVILLDLGLPGQDGFTVLRALRQTGVTRTSSVVVLTGRSEQAEVVQALQLGASAYVVKPFAIADLMVRVRSAIQSRAAS